MPQTQIQRVKEPQKLFKWAISQHIANDNSQKLHFYRSNRWRFNTMNKTNVLKFMKLKGPIVFGVITGAVLDYTYGFYNVAQAHH